MTGKKPTRIFTYPGGGRMCQHGKIRAAVWGKEILNDDKGKTAEEIKVKAEKGEWALIRGADTSKANLIANIVFWLFKTNQLDEYVNREGEFLDGHSRLTNLEQHKEVAKRFMEK